MFRRRRPAPPRPGEPVPRPRRPRRRHRWGILLLALIGALTVGFLLLRFLIIPLLVALA